MTPIIQSLQALLISLSALLSQQAPVITPTPITAPLVHTFGSVNSGQEYLATSTDSTFATNSTTTTLCTGTCTLGSITVASTTSTTKFGVWDSALGSTTATWSYNGGTSTSTKIVVFPVSPTQATYVFDQKVSRGIVLDIPLTFNGNYVVTWRQY